MLQLIQITYGQKKHEIRRNIFIKDNNQMNQLIEQNKALAAVS